MTNEETIKALVKQKYGEIALQDRETNRVPVAVRAVAQPKYIT